MIPLHIVTTILIVCQTLQMHTMPSVSPVWCLREHRAGLGHSNRVSNQGLSSNECTISVSYVYASCAIDVSRGDGSEYGWPIDWCWGQAFAIAGSEVNRAGIQIRLKSQSGTEREGRGTATERHNKYAPHASYTDGCV